MAAAAAACGGAQARRETPRRAERPVPSGGTSEASERCRDLLPLIRKAASEADVETALLVGVVRTESNFRNDARSPVGAYGLTQVMRATAKAKGCGDLSDPLENLRCGIRVLVAFLKHYDGNVYLGLAGYNAGHAMPDKARRQRELPANVQYVEDVLWARARFLAKGCAF
jgi:soluble lytic murein transglycosylase-like protein